MALMNNAPPERPASMKPPEQPSSSASVIRKTEAAPVAGILLLIGTTFLFTGLDTTAKYLSAELPTSQIVWMRFVSHVVLIAPFFFLTEMGRGAWRSNRPGLQLLRSALMVTTTFLNFLAVRYLQLADAVAIFFVAPLIVAALAGPLLNEWAGPRRWAAIVVGFLGVLVITRPGVGGLEWTALFALAAATVFALYTISTRILAGHDSTVTTFFYTPLIGLIGFAPFGIAVWETPPDLFHWLLLFMTGIVGGLGHLLMILAYRRAPAPVLAPFMYIQLIWMTASGILVFGDFPSSWTFIGAAIVVASGLYLWFREQQTAKGEPS